MKNSNVKALTLIVTGLLAGVASADLMERPGGIKIGERLTLRPYVTLGFTYDSNHDGQPNGDTETSWTINPAIDLTYIAESWNLDFNIFYGYRAYNEHSRALNDHSYGESLRYNWSNAPKSEKGWTLMLSESFRKVCEDDDLYCDSGRGLWRNRYQLDVNGALQRRITEKLHADVNAAYYLMDYDNKDSYAALYGWQRWSAGVELGYALSRWADLIVAGSYQRYYQENYGDQTGYAIDNSSVNYSHESQGYTVQAGLGSWLTERISYRALAGWSRFEYAGGAHDDNGFTYTLSLDWKIGETWHTMLSAQSYYMPSERDYGSANRVDCVSWGLGKSLIRGKLTATLDLAYRHETRVYTDANSYDYSEDILSGRIGLNYFINRFLSVYGNFEYQGDWFSGDVGGYDRDYDRFRINLGFRLAY